MCGICGTIEWYLVDGKCKQCIKEQEEMRNINDWEDEQSMTIHNQILGIISRNPGVTQDEIIENCINKEYATTFIIDLIDENKVKSIYNSGKTTYYINVKEEMESTNDERN